MGFLQTFVVALVLAVTSFTTATLGFLHIPMNNVSPVANGATTTPASNNKALAITSPSSNATLSPLGIQRGDGASTIPNEHAELYEGDGYTLAIPAGFVFDGVLNNYFPWDYVSWHSSGMDQQISIEWQSYSADAAIQQDEYATLRADKYEHIQAVISHPTIAGAASSTMRQTPQYSDGQTGIYLWVIGSNGNIYSVVGLASTPAARASVKQIVGSFSLLGQ